MYPLQFSVVPKKDRREKTSQFFLRYLSSIVPMKRTEIITGCSSYYNRKWIDIFYPDDLPAKNWFDYYCEYFDTYELNATFYRFPTAESLQAWYEKSPDGFIFSVKAPKLITHNKKFDGCKREISELYAACREGMKDKLGYVLFQLPPSFHYSPERLQQIISQLDPDIQNVVEFRHESWWNKVVYDTFIDNKLIFCSLDHPTLPTTLIETTATGYIRMHGNPQMFYSEYSPEALNTLYAAIKEAENFKKVMVFFNNTAGTGAILNALAMKGI